MVDEQGRLIDENGRFINEQGQFVDKDGNLVDKEGDYIIEFTPFLDDEGKPIVLDSSKNKDSTEDNNAQTKTDDNSTSDQPKESQ